MSLSETLLCRGPQPRILIVRLSKVADLVMATSLLEALRERWPAAYIAWVTEGRPGTLLDGDRRLDALIRVPDEVFRRPGTALHLRRELRGHQFDWVIDAQDDPRSRTISRLVPAAARISLASAPGKPFMFRHRLPKQCDQQLIACEYRKLAESITGRLGPAPLLPVSEATRSAAGSQMRDLGVDPGYVALCPFTNGMERNWPEQHWVRLAQLIAEQGLGRCVLFGGAAYQERADRLMRDMPASTLNMVSQLRLLNVPAWFAQASALVGVDTALTHVAVAVRRPVLALFGPQSPYCSGADSPLDVVTLPTLRGVGLRDGEQPPRPPTPAQLLRRLRRLLGRE